MPRQSILINSFLLPGLFVFMWSTGFIGSKIVMQHAPPLTFLTIRMALAAVVLIPILLWFKSQWPKELSIYIHSAIIGALVHAVYLGGVFWAISLGTGAGLSSLIVGLQPLLTLCLSVAILKEQLHTRKIAGVLVGLLGFIIVIVERSGINELSLAGLLLCSASLLGISAGTVYQKKISGTIDLLPAVFLQYVGATAVLLPLALWLEPFEITWGYDFIFATIWLIFVLSIGAVLLLMKLIQSAEAGNVASLFYLVPPLTALEAYILFDEQLSRWALLGMLFCVLGVAMVLHTGTKPSRNDK